MYCSQCGKEIANNSKFCPECGKEIPTTESQDKPKNLSDFEQAKLSAERTKKSQTDDTTQKDKNFTIFSIKGAGIVFGVVIILSFVISLFSDDEDSPSLEEAKENLIREIDSFNTTEHSSQNTEPSKKEPEMKQYTGCDGLEDLIPKLKSVGGIALGWYQIVNLGDRASCDKLISELNKPENYKD